MEARQVEALPDGPEWQFEPKWDGFRAIAARSGNDIHLMSKAGKPLGRYFPEIVAALAATEADDYLLDGELILPRGNELSFDALQQRLHPAASRITRLSQEAPAQLMLFDCLRLHGRDLQSAPLEERRAALISFLRQEDSAMLLLSPASADRDQALAWLAHSGGALDGIIAKSLTAPYQAGERAMLKIKPLRSADCVVGGFRPTTNGRGVASLLLGLYNEDGKLDHVGFTSGFAAVERPQILAHVHPYVNGAGFSGKAPGGQSRWRKEGDATWTALAPVLVAEVSYDQVTARRFRHGARFLRWRPDKAPEQCTMEQLAPPLTPAELGTLLAV